LRRRSVIRLSLEEARKTWEPENGAPKIKRAAGSASGGLRPNRFQ